MNFTEDEWAMIELERTRIQCEWLKWCDYQSTAEMARWEAAERLGLNGSLVYQDAVDRMALVGAIPVPRVHCMPRKVKRC